MMNGVSGGSKRTGTRDNHDAGDGGKRDKQPTRKTAESSNVIIDTAKPPAENTDIECTVEIADKGRLLHP